MRKWLCPVALAAMLVPLVGGASNPAPTALDMARILMEQGGAIDQATIDQLFSTGVEGNMRIPPEHLGVAFYDKRSGEPLDRNEIRELMGAGPQDGAHQLLEMASDLGGGLPMENAQLRALLDAAFVASLRRPEDHFDVEFYDRRVGPTGRGGGVSGSTPNRVHAPAPAESVASERAETTHSSRYPPSLPDSLEALGVKLRSLGFEPQQRQGQMQIPVVVWGKQDEDFGKLADIAIAELADEGLVFEEMPDDPRAVQDGEWIVIYGMAWFTAISPAIAREMEGYMAEVFPR